MGVYNQQQMVVLMHRRLHHALGGSSEMRALFVSIILFALRTWRRIRSLHPRQVILPATIVQIAVFVFAAWTPEHFVFTFAGGNFMILAFIMLPVMLRPAEVKVHWVKPQE